MEVRQTWLHFEEVRGVPLNDTKRRSKLFFELESAACDSSRKSAVAVMNLDRHSPNMMPLAGSFVLAVRPNLFRFSVDGGK